MSQDTGADGECFRGVPVGQGGRDGTGHDCEGVPTCRRRARYYHLGDGARSRSSSHGAGWSFGARSLNLTELMILSNMAELC